MKVPDFIQLLGDEDGGVEAYCRRRTHTHERLSLGYYGWWPPRDVATAGSVQGLLDLIEAHIRTEHPEAVQ